MSRLLKLSFVVVLLALASSQVATAQSCSVTLSASGSTSSIPAAGGNGNFSVSSAPGCQWTSLSSVPWITISFGQSGTQNGSVGFTVAANDSTSARNGTITVNDKTYTVTQAGGTCIYQLSATGTTVSSAGGPGSVALSTLNGCAWQATTLSPWITINTPSGTGPGTIQFTIAPTTAARTGTIQIQQSTFTVTQSGPCSVTVASTFAPVSGNGGTVSVPVTASGNNCAYSSVSNNPDWISITGGDPGTGSGTITLIIAPNTLTSPRTGSITINGSVTVQISQLGNSCTYTLLPVSGTAQYTGGTGTISVQTQAGCVWNAKPSVDWLGVTGTTSGTGPGTVTYVATQNLNSTARTGGIAIGTAVYYLTQSGVGCQITLDRTSGSIPAEGGRGTVSVSAPTGCDWTVSADQPWVAPSVKSGTGIGEVSFDVQANTTASVRTANLLIGTTSYRISQTAAACRIGLASTNGTAQAAGGTGSVAIQANCAWTAVSNVPWIVITSAAAGNSDTALSYQVQPNSTANDRTGTITIAGQTYTVTQPGQRCNLSLSANLASLPARGGAGSVNVTGGSSCTWSATGGDSWLSIDYASVGGSGTVRFSADPNTTGSARTTSVSVSGQSITIQQPPISVTISAAGIVNAASFAGSASVSAGEIVTIYGTGFGPASIAGLQMTSNRLAVASQTGDTRVLFDDTPSPMIYSIEGQLSAIVPYDVAAKQTVSVQVEYLGVQSNSVMVAVSPAVPGVFTLTQNGKGQAAVLNQNNSVNGPGAAAAARGSVIQIFGTGEGPTRPAGADGKLAVAPIPVPVGTVRVFIGGIEAQVLYAGGAPGLVAGLLQVNARVPDTISTGDTVPLEIRVNDAPSQSGATIAVR